MRRTAVASAFFTKCPVKMNRSGWKTTLFLVTVALALVANAQAGAKFKILHAFGRDEGGLYDSLVIDHAGNLYGTERGGGTYGYGAVFELTRGSQGRWTESVLHSFNCKERAGCIPEAGLVLDVAGNLYGRTSTHVFELKPSSGGWKLSVLYDHGGPSNLLLDQAGNLYAPLGPGKYDLGGIGELVKGEDWKENWLYSFCPQKPCVDGWGPSAGVTWGPTGSLYGTTVYGGDSPYCGNVGCGVVYELTPEKTGSWKETVLHSFPATKNDGSKLYDGIILDKSGNLYGATSQGGSSTNCGVIFKLSPKADGKWDETILYDFPKPAEGCSANTLAFDKKGNLWGTAQGGTGTQCAGGCGVVFKMTPAAKGKWKYSVVHNFAGTDGAIPAAAVIFDKHGNLYGTTELGGPGHSVGVVFEITP
jgi:uncharacterized repeat protein (TIGR03803 family)